MGEEELEQFFELPLDEIGKRYSQVVKNREWTLNRPTKQRAGAFWPRGGFRSLSLKSDFVENATGQVIKGKRFDEIDNFKNSALGEIASRPRCPSLPGKEILYAIYSYRGYAFVSRPCTVCLRIGNRDCGCDAHLSTLIEEFRDIIEYTRKDTTSAEITTPFNLNLERKFKLRVASDFGKPVPGDRDSLTIHHYGGCFVAPEDILIDEAGGISAAKPQKPGVKDILRSIFRFKDAPDNSFILPEGDLRGKDLKALIDGREEQLSDKQSDKTSETSDEVHETSSDEAIDALKDLEDSLVSGGGTERK